MWRIIFLAFLISLVSCGQQKASVESEVKPAANATEIVSYENRKALYQKWKADLEKLAADTKSNAFNQVSQFLGTGVAMAVPQQTDRTFEIFDEREGNALTVLVLFPSDRNIAPFWKELYDKEHVGAYFRPNENLLIIRAEEVAPRMRGIMLGHEGFHGLFFNKNGRKVDQTDEEYCDEEAIAHRIEIETMKALSPKLARAAETDGLAIAKKIRSGNINIEISVASDMLDEALGKPMSKLDTDYRATMYSHMAYYNALSRLYKGDEERATAHFSDHLCGVYKKYGIR